MGSAISCNYISVTCKDGTEYKYHGNIRFYITDFDAEGHYISINIKSSDSNVRSIDKRDFRIDHIKSFTFGTTEETLQYKDDEVCNICAHKPSNGISTNAVCLRCKDGDQFVSAFL